MAKKRPSVGDVVQIDLPNGTYAYGRVLRDASVAFYRQRTSEPQNPPIGSRDYEFTVGVYDDDLRSDRMHVVGYDPSIDLDDEWPPPFSVRDPVTGRVRLYARGQMRSATEEECQGLERAAGWAHHHLVDRLMGGTRFIPGSLRGH